MRAPMLIPVVALAAGCTAQPAPPVPAPAPAPVAKAAPPAPHRPLDPGERVENPAYARWANCPVGTVAVIEEKTEGDGVTTSTTMTYRLAERTDDAAVVEAGGAIKAPDGTVQENPPTPLRHVRWVAKPEGKDADPARPVGTYAAGEETIAVRGKEYKTRWYKSKGRVEAGETETQTWYCDDVPGGLVKSVHRVPATRRTITAELVEIRKP